MKTEIPLDRAAHRAVARRASPRMPLTFTTRHLNQRHSPAWAAWHSDRAAPLPPARTGRWRAGITRSHQSFWLIF